jgi:hypothetical protein
MRGGFASPCNTSRDRITAQARGLLEGWVVGRCEVTCRVVSGKFPARVLLIRGSWGVRLTGTGSDRADPMVGQDCGIPTFSAVVRLIKNANGSRPSGSPGAGPDQSTRVVRVRAARCRAVGPNVGSIAPPAVWDLGIKGARWTLRSGRRATRRWSRISIGGRWSAGATLCATCQSSTMIAKATSLVGMLLSLASIWSALMNCSPSSRHC